VWTFDSTARTGQQDLHPTSRIRQTERGGAGHEAPMGDNSNAYGVLVRKPAEKRPPGRPRRKRKNIIKVTAFLWLRIQVNGVLFNTVINLLFVREMRGIS